VEVGAVSVLNICKGKLVKHSHLAASIELTASKEKSCFADIAIIAKLKFLRHFIASLGGLQIFLRRSVMRRHAGFTLIELTLVIAILAILAAFGISYYGDYRDKINVNKTITDILHMGVLIKQFENDNLAFPGSLSDVGAGAMLDPWGNPYQYLNISSVKGKGKLRKDKSLNPINSDYDLYSMGKDGMSSTALTAKNSHDDVIRARDGKFVGLASDF